MNRTYLIKGNDLLDLVDQLDIFDKKVIPFLKKNGGYKYTRDIYHDTKDWVLDITIDNGTGEEKTFREIIRSS